MADHSTSAFRICGERVLLRGPRPEDVDALLRWDSVETGWQDWDAPWEGTSIIAPGEMDAARERAVARLESTRQMPPTTLWGQLVVGPLLGWVSHYHHDREKRTTCVGIDICESLYWGEGLGTEALRLWIGYLFESLDLDRVFMGTWSGNERMIRCAAKCAFVLVDRNDGVREVRGQMYDGLRFELTRERWAEMGSAR
jgi:RimJ/RimL family protein N-acetyltransferase